MKRLMWRLSLSLAAVLVVSSLALYLLVAASLPIVDGEASTYGISADVRIDRDATGIPTVVAKTRADVAFGTGFVHGQDRFFQMDLTRRQAAGELAEIFGPVALEADRRNRFHRFRSRAHDVVRLMAGHEAETMNAYVAGVNAGLHSLAAKPFEYFVLGVSPKPWEIEDSILVVYAMFLELNDERASRDVKRGLVQRIVPPEVFEWLYPEGTEWDAPLVGGITRTAPIPTADIFDLRGRRTKLTAPTHGVSAGLQPPGSNNWAVGGSLSSSGAAIIASDMHLKLAVPGIFYRARLIVEESPERDISGVTLPGTPAIIAGSNGSVAWGFTNSYGDWSDAVIIRPGSRADYYLTPDGERTFARHAERVVVKGERAEDLVITETIWGPVLDDTGYPEGRLAVRWLAHEPGSVNLRQLELETARSVAEALQIANRSGIPPQNFVCGDRDGNIGWTIAGRIPLRADYDSSVPADWSASEGWIGWLEAEQYPRIVNPTTGRIWTANARVIDGDALKIIGVSDYELGARARQIRDDLFASASYVPQDMLAIQLDDRALFLTPWRSLLLSVLDDAAVRDHPRRREYRELVDNWIPRASADSVGYRLVRAFRDRVQETVFRNLTAPVREAYGAQVELWISSQFEGPLWRILQERPAHLLPEGYADWQQLLLQAVDRNIEYFAANFDGGLADRRWGERNRAAIRHPLSRALPILSRWLDMPRDALGGDSNLPKAQGADWGASERFAVSPGDEAGGYLHMPTGQSGHPLSEFYRAGHEDWVRGRPSAFLPGPTQHVLILRKAGNNALF